MTDKSHAGHDAHEDSLPPEVTLLQDVTPPFLPEGASSISIIIEWPPGHPGTPPHRHSGPAFGYVLEGAIRFEVEGKPERVIKAGEAFWEAGGDVIHYQDANALSDAPSKFLVTMLRAPGEPLLTFVDADELQERAHLRAPRPTAG
ncbi:cupin domain-containing protein [Actinacidiphila glaucinigra]|uniref:cupin domain-containing protein n=1 Tax=Actinacidiphila glaucinigra TaxID=235986 RepID=UPI0037CC88D8